MTTPLMTMILHYKKMVSSLNFQTKNSVSFPFHMYSTKNKKLENGEDIEEGSSSAVVLNQSKKN